MKSLKYSFQQQKSAFPDQYQIVKMINVTKRIFRVINKINNAEAVIKELISNNSQMNKYNTREKSLAEMCQELCCQKSYNPHVIKYYDVIFIEQSTFIVMELCDCDLQERLKQMEFHSKLKTNEYLCQALDIFKQVLVGYQYLLQQFGPQFMHRDIKPQNVLYSKTEGLYKLCDFGLSKMDDFDNPTAYVGTINYMAPEIQKGEKYDNRCDIFSVGVLLFWIITGEVDVYQKKNQISNQYLLEIIEWMTWPNPENRITWETLFTQNIFLLSPQEFLAQKKEMRQSLISTNSFSKIIPTTRSNDNESLSNVNTSYLKLNQCNNYLALNTLFADAFKQIQFKEQQITAVQRCLFALWSKIYDKAILNENNQELIKQLNKCKEIIQIQQLLRLQNSSNEIEEQNIEFLSIQELCEFLLKKIKLWQGNKQIQEKFKNFLKRNENSQNIVFPEQ